MNKNEQNRLLDHFRYGVGRFKSSHCFPALKFTKDKFSFEIYTKEEKEGVTSLYFGLQQIMLEDGQWVKVSSLREDGNYLKQEICKFYKFNDLSQYNFTDFTVEARHLHSDFIDKVTKHLSELPEQAKLKFARQLANSYQTTFNSQRHRNNHIIYEVTDIPVPDRFEKMHYLYLDFYEEFKVYKSLPNLSPYNAASVAFDKVVEKWGLK